MGILDFFSKKPQQTKPVAVQSVEELRKQLFEAIERNHMVEFEMLCADNPDVIARHFAQWKKAPDEIRNDKDLFKKYAYCLMIIASHFQKQRNNPELMTMLTGIDDSELSRSWQADLGQAQQMMQQLQLDEAIPILQGCLDRVQGVSGAGVEKFLPLTLGFLGECHFHSNRMDKAEEFMERAYQHCSMSGDVDACLAYRSNMYEIYRHTGNLEKAMECAKEIGEKQYERGELVQASNWREQVKALKKGEPLHRVVVRIAEETFELEDLPKVEGEKVEFVLNRNRIELVRCTQKCFEGRDLAQKGDFDGALVALEEASKLDPYSPQPHFLSGAINLAGRRYAEAIASFEKVEELCPGFETSRSDLWLAKQLAEGKMEHDACMVAFEVNNSEVPAEQRINILNVLIDKYPNFGECYYKLGKIYAEANMRDEALAAWHKGLELATDEMDLRSRLLRDLAIVSEDMADKKKYLNELIAIENGNVLAHGMAHFMMRQISDD